MEAMIRIKSNFTMSPTLSVSGSLSCSRYNQGCNGGYPFLVGKHGHDVGFFEVNAKLLFNYRSLVSLIQVFLKNALINAIRCRRFGRFLTMVCLLLQGMLAKGSMVPPTKGRFF